MQVKKPHKERPKDYAERRERKMFLQLEQTDAALKALRASLTQERE